MAKLVLVCRERKRKDIKPASLQTHLKPAHMLRPRKMWHGATQFYIAFTAINAVPHSKAEENRLRSKTVIFLWSSFSISLKSRNTSHRQWQYTKHQANRWLAIHTYYLQFMLFFSTLFLDCDFPSSPFLMTGNIRLRTRLIGSYQCQ